MKNAVRLLKEWYLLNGFPGGAVVKNLPSNAGDLGLIPGQGTETPHGVLQLRPNSAKNK